MVRPAPASDISISRKITYWLLIAAVIATCASYIKLDSSGNTIGRLTVIPAGMSWLIWKIESKRFRAWGPLVYTIVAFIVFSCISVFWSVDVDASREALSRMMSNMVIVVLIWDMGFSKKEAQGLVQAFIIAFYIGFASLLKNASAGSAQIEDRFTADGVHADAAGFLVLLGAPIAWQLGISKEPMHWFLRFLNLMYPIMAIVTVILSATRADLFLAIPVVLFILFTLRKGSVWVPVILASGLAAMGVAVMMGKFTTQLARLGTSFSSVFTDGGNGRLDNWKVALHFFSRHPFIGTGINTSATNSLKQPGDHAGILGPGWGLATHNMYLGVLSELGLIGFCLLGGISLILLMQASKMPKQYKAGAVLSVCLFILGNAQVPFMLMLQNWVYMMVVGSWFGTYAIAQKVKAAKPIPAPMGEPALG